MRIAWVITGKAWAGVVIAVNANCFIARFKSTDQ